MSKKRKSIIIILISIFIFLILSIVLILYFNEYNKYKITYYDEATPGSKYDISIKNNTVEITETHFCNSINCKSTTENETFNYSNDNIKKLEKFIKNNFSKRRIEIYQHDLTEKELETIEGILIGEYYFEINVEDYKYKIEYSKNDSLTYEIYFKDDNTILVKRLEINNYAIKKVDTYKLDFKKENISILNNYIIEEVKKENRNTIIKSSTLLKDEINIFNSIVENNEEYLNNNENEPKLSYTIEYEGIECDTPTLYLYSDNTYEYHDKFSINNKKITPKIGNYDYDITKIINNIDKYEKNDFESYIIKDKDGKSYITSTTNIELNELLTSLDVKLDKCLERESSE